MNIPISTRDDVERIHAEQRLASAPRPDALLNIPSFTPTEPTSSVTNFANALIANDRDALLRGYRVRNRRHPTELK